MEWWTTTNGVQEFMSDARAGKAAVLVGAGVSIPAPTQLPSGLELRDAAVGSLLSMAGLGREWQSLRSSDAYKAMVPEEAFEQCTVVLMDELIPFFGFIAGRMPNVVHQALSSVLSRFDVLAATTNFDTFIEDSSSTPVEVIHLHGSVRSPSSLVVRLNQVGRGLGRPVVQQIRSMLEGRRLWVFGYSGADRDVMDVISEEARTIVWHYLTRHDERSLANTRPLEGKLVGVAGALEGAWAQQILASLSASEVLSPPRSKPFRIEQWANRWAKDLEPGSAFAIALKLNWTLGRYRQAIDIGERGARSETVSEYRRTYLLVDTANNCRLLGRFDEGLRLVDQAIAILAGLEQPGLEASAYLTRGVLLLEQTQPDPIAAIAEFEEALVLVENYARSDPPPIPEAIWARLGKVHNNIGLANATAGHLLTSLDHYRVSLRMKRRTGELAGAASTMANMSIAALRMGNTRLSRDWRRRTEELTDRYGWAYAAGYLHRELGIVMCTRGRLKSGIELLDQALMEFLENPDWEFDRELTSNALNRYAVDRRRE